MRELAYLSTDVGHVVAGVITEIGMIPVDAQDPALVAEALACARIMDDPESAIAAPAALARLTTKLDVLHEAVETMIDVHGLLTG